MKQNDTKTQILDAAIELFWSKSYHGVNMNELSRAAGVNKATVYQHFGSKEEVALAAIKRAAERTEDYLFHTTFEEASTPKEQIQIIYRKAYEVQKAIHDSDGSCRGCPFVNIGVELATSNEAIRKAVAQVFRSFRGYYAQIVDAVHQNTQTSGDGNRGDMATDLVNSMNGVLVAAKLENRPDAILEGQRRALQILAL